MKSNMNLELSIYRGVKLGTHEWVEGHLYTNMDDDSNVNTYIIPQKQIIYKTKMNDIALKSFIGLFQVYPMSVGQFTGKHDRNKTRIFTGDAIRSKDKTSIHVVNWYPTRAAFKCEKYGYKTGDRSHLLDIHIIAKNGEIIGNAFENPEYRII